MAVTDVSMDGDGIPDGDEVVYQTAVEEIDQERVAGITKVAVSMDCAGYIDNEVSIFNVYNLDMRTTDVVGRVGAAVDIETTQEFDEATITFTYDEEALGDSLEDNLRIVWYDEENDQYVVMDEETVIDKENNTLSCKTSHFSTWLVVDVLKWIEVISKLPDYKVQDKEVKYRTGYVFYDLDLDTIKNSRVWWGEKRITYRPVPYIAWTCGSGMRRDDYQTANLSVEECFNRAFELVSRTWIHNYDEYPKQVYFANTDDIEYLGHIVDEAKAKNIVLNFVTPKGANNPNMRRMASETDGVCLTVNAWNFETINKLFNEDPKRVYWKVYKPQKDRDGDGLIDLYEEKGMLLSNMTVVHSDPGLVDSDGDEISDFVEVGGLPIEVKLKLLGKEYTVPMFKGALYDKLSDDFIFVDGTPNEDGKVITQKMKYVPYLEKNKFAWYEEPDICRYKGIGRKHIGRDGIYRRFSDMQPSAADIAVYIYTDNVALNFLSMQMMDSPLNLLTRHMMDTAYDCFKTYVYGAGGGQKGIIENGTRKYVGIGHFLVSNIYNSAREKYLENISSVKQAAESVLNDYNTDIYIAVAPHAQNWEGCSYVKDFTEKEEIIAGIANFEITGTFNVADAVATAHCTYNPQTKEYNMEYIYYLTDYYDFEKAYVLEEENMLGYSKAYELYGVFHGETQWKK